jgi:hypothetical protein
MIFNIYLPENDRRLIEQLKSISEKKRRSLSFLMREALEFYLLEAAKRREEEPLYKRRTHNAQKADE